MLSRVERGEALIVTRDGAELAELRPLRRRSARPAELIERRRHVRQVDPEALRRDLDDVLDASL